MTRLIPVAISLACGLLAASAFAESPFKFEDTPGKLPKIVVPAAYRLELAPDLEALSFAGKEQIDIDVAEPTDTVPFCGNTGGAPQAALESHAHTPDNHGASRFIEDSLSATRPRLPFCGSRSRRDCKRNPTDRTDSRTARRHRGP